MSIKGNLLVITNRNGGTQLKTYMGNNKDNRAEVLKGCSKRGWQV